MAIFYDKIIEMGSRFLEKFMNCDHESKPKGYFWIVIIFLLVAISVSIVFFSRSRYDLSALTTTPNSQREQERPSRIYLVSYRNGTFSPTNLRIKAGDSVRFENNGLFGIHVISDPHPKHNGLAGFDSLGPIPSGGVFSYTFSKSGIFGYHNESNLSEAGKIIVR